MLRLLLNFCSLTHFTLWNRTIPQMSWVFYMTQGHLTKKLSKSTNVPFYISYIITEYTYILIIG